MHHEKMKREATGKKKIFAAHIFNKGSYLEYRKNLYKSVRERQTTHLKNGQNT